MGDKEGLYPTKSATQNSPVRTTVHQATASTAFPKSVFTCTRWFRTCVEALQSALRLIPNFFFPKGPLPFPVGDFQCLQRTAQFTEH